MVLNSQEYTLLLGKSLVHSLVHSYHSLLRLLHTTCFACAPSCAHSFARSLTLLTPSLVGKWMIRWLFILCFFYSGPLCTMVENSLMMGERITVLPASSRLSEWASEQIINYSVAGDWREQCGRASGPILASWFLVNLNHRASPPALKFLPFYPQTLHVTHFCSLSRTFTWLVFPFYHCFRLYRPLSLFFMLAPQSSCFGYRFVALILLSNIRNIIIVKILYTVPPLKCAKPLGC